MEEIQTSGGQIFDQSMEGMYQCFVLKLQLLKSMSLNKYKFTYSLPEFNTVRRNIIISWSNTIRADIMRKVDYTILPEVEKKVENIVSDRLSDLPTFFFSRHFFRR